MSPEAIFASFVARLDVDSVPEHVSGIAKRILSTVCGTAVAGAAEDGIGALRELVCLRGGRPEASSLVFGDKLPAISAAMLNGSMCRALDYCDAMLPGLHIGSSLVPAAFAAAELAGGCSGREFLAALVAGGELASRMNLSESLYDGFDPTGVAAVFGATAAAARILHLTEVQTLHALALAFNRCGGSFQSNVDGSLAVRLIQGWVAETGVQCAQLAQCGMTGPANFLTGVYGYLHLYGRDRVDASSVVEGLGAVWRLEATVFKKYPSCGGTQAMTELALDLVRRDGLDAGELELLEVHVRPYTHKLVGHPFRLGENPRVNAQFSAQYCVASAIVRGSCGLSHFRPEAIGDARVLALVERIRVVPEDRLIHAGEPVAVLIAHGGDGRRLERALDFAPGFPGNPLSSAEHRARFDDCMEYAPFPLCPSQTAAFLSDVDRLEELDEARALLETLRTVGGESLPPRAP